MGSSQPLGSAAPPWPDATAGSVRSLARSMHILNLHGLKPPIHRIALIASAQLLLFSCFSINSSP